MTALPSELLTDRYQFTMADSYLAEGTADGRVAFELFVRELPPRRGFLIAAGLEQVVELLVGLRFGDESLRYLRSSGTASAALCERLATLRFDGDLHAVPEGTAVAAGEPLLRVEGSRLLCQLVESVLAQPDELPDADRHQGGAPGDRCGRSARGRLRAPPRARRRRRRARRPRRLPGRVRRHRDRGGRHAVGHPDGRHDGPQLRDGPRDRAGRASSGCCATSRQTRCC